MNKKEIKEVKYELALFAGGGGGILGGILCGHTCVGSCEIEAYPRKILLARQRDGLLPKFPIWDDIRTFRSDNPECGEYFDFLRSIKDELVITGGFPCQDISCAGKGVGIEGERSGLWKEMQRIICEVRPAKTFVENSPMLVGRGLALVLGDLAEMGYDAKWCVLGGHHSGGHCKGDRLWIMGTTVQERREGRNCSSREHYSLAKYSGQRTNRIRGISENKQGSDTQKNLKAVERRGAQCLPSEEREEVQRRIVWNTPPKSIRVAYDVANRVDRIAAVGNGQDPAVVKLAWKTLDK